MPGVTNNGTTLQSKHCWRGSVNKLNNLPSGRQLEDGGRTTTPNGAIDIIQNCTSHVAIKTPLYQLYCLQVGASTGDFY